MPQHGRDGERTGLMAALEPFDTQDKIEALAQELGCSVSTIWNWKSGARSPGKAILFSKVAPRLNISPEAAIALVSTRAHADAKSKAKFIAGSGDTVALEKCPGVSVKREIHSVISQYLKKLEGDQIMLLRLDGTPVEVEAGTLFKVEKVIGQGGGAHAVIATIFGKAIATKDESVGGAHRQSVTKMATGRPRNMRRKPGLGDRLKFDEDEDAREE